LFYFFGIEAMAAGLIPSLLKSYADISNVNQGDLLVYTDEEPKTSASRGVLLEPFKTAG